MKIYTRKGDEGETSLFGGNRVPKTNALIEAYGTLDELNSHLGVVRSHNPSEKIEQICRDLQNELFTLGADLATPVSKKEKIARISEKEATKLESLIDELDESLESLTYFILPAGTPAAAHLHVCRTVCRRAERLTIRALAETELNRLTIAYLNRLSDLLFTMARYENIASGESESKWKVD